MADTASKTASVMMMTKKRKRNTIENGKRGHSPVQRFSLLGPGPKSGDYDSSSRIARKAIYDLASHTLDNMCQTLGSKAGQLWVHDSLSDGLRMVHHSLMTKEDAYIEMVAHYETFLSTAQDKKVEHESSSINQSSFPQGFPWRVWRSQTPIQMETLNDSTETPNSGRTLGIPILHDNKTLAILVFLNDSSAEHQSDVLSLLSEKTADFLRELLDIFFVACGATYLLFPQLTDLVHPLLPLILLQGSPLIVKDVCRVDLMSPATDAVVNVEPLDGILSGKLPPTGTETQTEVLQSASGK